MRPMRPQVLNLWLPEVAEGFIKEPAAQPPHPQASKQGSALFQYFTSISRILQAIRGKKQEIC